MHQVPTKPRTEMTLKRPIAIILSIFQSWMALIPLRFKIWTQKKQNVRGIICSTKKKQTRFLILNIRKRKIRCGSLLTTFKIRWKPRKMNFLKLKKNIWILWTTNKMNLKNHRLSSWANLIKSKKRWAKR